MIAAATVHAPGTVPLLVPGSDEHRLHRSVSASAVACLLGSHPFLTIEQYAAMKRGEAPWDEENERMRFGHRAEQWIADDWEREYGIALVKPEHSYQCGPLTANPDRLVVGAPHVIVECKATGDHEGAVKTYWWLQLQAQFACTGATEGFLSVLWGSDLVIRHYPVGRDEDAIASLLTEAETFLACLDMGLEPTAVERDATAPTIELGEQEAAWAKELMLLNEAKNHAEREAKRIKALLDAAAGGPGLAVGSRAVLTHDGKPLMRLRRQRGREQTRGIGTYGDDYSVLEAVK